MPVLVIGETVLDLVSRSPANFQDGLYPFRGGTGANVAVRLARMGVSAQLLSSVGRDQWGQALHEWLRAEGVDLTLFGQVAGAPTAVSVISLDADGNPSFVMHAPEMGSGVWGDMAKVVATISGVTVVFATSTSLLSPFDRACTLEVAKRASGLKKIVMFDANIRLERWPDRDAVVSACADMLSTTTVFKCNRDDALLITGAGSLDKAVRRLLLMGPDAVVVTLGHEGAILRGSAHAMIPAAPATVVSSLGAGDAVTAGLIAGLVKSGGDLSRLPAALEQGVAEAGHSVAFVGAIEPHPL